MSGGYFDYNQYKINQIADNIEHLIETNDSNEPKEWGGTIGNHYPIEVIDKFKDAVKALKKASIMTQRVDWLLSGDDGTESFLRRLDDELKELEESDAKD